MELTPYQKKKLRGMAHDLRPTVQVGVKGLTDNLVTALENELEAHELVKVKFGEFKKEKGEIISALEERTGSVAVGLIGNVAIFFRYQHDPEKREIELPRRKNRE